MNDNLVIGITGNNRVGKDTLCVNFRQIHKRVQRYAFADALKNDLAGFIRANFKFDIFNCTPEQKELVRPIMIAYGCAKRAVDINYWAKQVVTNIESDQSYDTYSIIPVITDVRFESEAIFLKKSFGKNFKLIAVNRSDAPEPTEEEKKNYPAVAALADFTVNWGGNSAEEQLKIARGVWGNVND